MEVLQVGNNSEAGTRYQKEIIFKTYSYQDGRGQEKVYYAKDCVEISMDSYEIPPYADNYEEVKSMLKKQGSNKIASLGNSMFYETDEVMKDYYSGKLNRDEVKDIFKEYFYHYMGTSSADRKECGVGDVQPNCSLKQFATSRLAGLYEYFSRANTRNACGQNWQEGKELMESNGMSWRGTYYYNADWYYACEEMQELFRETADELADEYGVERVDFQYVEENTRFTLDGGITYNGVWDAVKWQRNVEGPVSGKFLDQNMAPPRGFVYCGSGYGWDGKGDLEGIKAGIKNKKEEYSSMMLILTVAQGTSAGKSLLFDSKNYSSQSSWKEDDYYKQAISFLRNFDMNWNFRGDRWEFMFAA